MRLVECSDCDGSGVRIVAPDDPMCDDTRAGNEEPCFCCGGAGYIEDDDLYNEAEPEKIDELP